MKELDIGGFGEGYSVQFSSVTQSCPTLCDPMNHSTPGLPVHHQLPEFTSIESVMPSSHLIRCRPLLLLPPIFPNIRVFSNGLALHQVAKLLDLQLQHQSFQGILQGISLQSKGLSRVFSNTTVQKHQFFGAQPSSRSNSHIHT